MAPIALMAPMHSDTLQSPRQHTPEEIENLSVEISDPPRRNKKNLRNFEIFLPKFHFILPNFYFPVPWGNFVSS